MGGSQRGTAGPGDIALRLVAELLQQSTHSRTSSLSKHKDNTANDFSPACCNRWTTVSTRAHTPGAGRQLPSDRFCSLLLARPSPLCTRKAALTLCFLQACVHAPTPTTPSFVPSAFLINSHSRCCGLAGLNFTRSQTRIIVEHLATHRTVSPLLFTTAPLCPGGRLATAEGNCRRVLREIKTQSKETDSVNRRAQNAHC